MSWPIWNGVNKACPRLPEVSRCGDHVALDLLCRWSSNLPRCELLNEFEWEVLLSTSVLWNGWVGLDGGSGGAGSRANCKDVVIAVVDYTSRAAKLTFISGRQSQDVLCSSSCFLLLSSTSSRNKIMCVLAFGERAKGTQCRCRF